MKYNKFFEKANEPAKEEQPIVEEQKEKIYWDVKEI